LGRGQQHGHMAVVTTGVHFSGVLAAVIKLVELLDGQGIHVGAQTNGSLAGAAFEHADHTGLTQATVDLNAPFGELGSYHIGSALLLKTKFGMRVDIAAHSADAGGLGNK